MSKKLRDIISIVISVCIFTLVFYSVFETVRFEADNGLEITAFRYFTILSNILCALISIYSIVISILSLLNKEIKLNKIHYVIKLCGTFGVTVTFLTVIFFLGPIVYSYESMLSGVNLHLHLIVPLLAILQFVFCDNRVKASWWFSFLPLIEVIIYGIVYALNVVVFKNWPDFYGFVDVSKLLLSIGFMGAGSIGIGFGLFFLNRLTFKYLNK